MEPATWTYQHKTLINFGPGVLSRLPDVAAQFAGKGKILLVTGSSGAMKKSGVTDRVVGMLGAARVVLFDKIPPNPPTYVVHEGVEVYKREKCSLVVGLGGGSPIDAAKAIAVMVNNKGDIADYFLRKKVWGPKSEPVIAIPTTSGTGTEVNPNFVATVPQGNAKYGAAPACAWPAVAIIDPELTLTLPPDQTASTGLDALSHAFEALWCGRRQPVSDINSYEAIPIILKWLPVACENGSNIEARTRMSYASMVASFAFGNTGTAGAHALSYVLTTKWNLPHGFACAFTLPEFLEFNFPTFDAEKKQRVLSAMGVSGEAEAVAKLRTFCEKFGTPKKLSDLGISEAEVADLVAAANPFVIQNNARAMAEADIAEIWRKKLA